MIIRSLFIHLLSLFFASFAFALPAPIDKDGVICSATLCAFNERGGFYGGATALYLRPTETGIGLVTDSWQYVHSNNRLLAINKPADPNHEWEGGAKLGYHFPLSANTIEANYLHLDNDTHAVNDNSSHPFSFGSVFFPNVTRPLSAANLFISDAHLRYRLNQVDLKAGRKYTDLSDRFLLRPALGLRYLRVEHRLIFMAPGNVLSAFDGVGPLFSIDGKYRFNYGLSLIGYLDYAMVSGQTKTNSRVTVMNVDYGFISPKRDRLVSSTTGKLGVDYSRFLGEYGQLTIEGGYQVSAYTNAIDLIQGEIFSEQKIVDIHSNNFSFRGPYISFTFHA